MGMEKRGGTNTHSGQGYHGENQWVSSTGERVGVPKKTPASSSYLTGGGRPAPVAKGLTSGEQLRSGRKPRLGAEGL